MNFDHLLHFMFVVEEKTMTKAAELLHISQPAISKSIRQLETELGVELFDRSSKLLLLTEEGKIFLKYVKQISSVIRKFETELNTFKELELETIGINLFSCSAIFPKIMYQFKQIHNHVFFKINQKRNIQEEYNIKIFSSYFNIYDSHNFLLCEEEVLLAIPSSDNLSNKNKITRDDIKDKPFILVSEKAEMRETLEYFFKLMNINPRINLESDNPSLVRDMIMYGLGFSLVPMKTWNIQSEKFVLKPVDQYPLKRYTFLSIENEEQLTETDKKFISFVRMYFSQL